VREKSYVPTCADDGEATRTPSAWMILLVSSLALWQILFFVWVTLSEHKWVILAERRGFGYVVDVAQLNYIPADPEESPDRS
jgi:hypothetical protein